MDKRIGAQLYTVRDYTQTLEDFENTIKKVRDIGYKSVQLSAIGNFEASKIKEICDKYGVIPACTHRSWQEYTENIDWSIDFHKALGCKIAGLGSYPNIWGGIEKEDMIKSVEIMNDIYDKFSANGMTFAYHNHHIEFMKIDGQFIMDYFLEKGKFDFIVDVYWLAYAGINPADYIRKMGKRATVIHFKDMNIIPGEKSHQMAEVMEGNLDWDSIIKASKEAGAEWAMVEQDICQRDPFESLAISYNNLKTKGFI